VADCGLLIWHDFFGIVGSHNYVNILQRSPVFVKMTKDNAPPVSYVINGNTYTQGYDLADDIYPQWPVIVKTIRDPYWENKAWFAKCQES
jgi:hypothetical protein